MARDKQRTGEYNAAQRILLEAMSEAPHSPLLLNQLGSVEQDLGQYLEAERSYLLALAATVQTDGATERLVILSNLGALYLDTGQYSKGEAVREQLEKLVPETLQGHPVAAAKLLNTLASLNHERHRDDQAQTYYARSIQLLHQAEGPSSAEAALVESNLAFLRLEAGRYEGAAELFRRAIGEIETVLGPQSPALIRPLVNLAKCENMSGHSEEAERVARRAIELSVMVLGERHPVTATAMLEQATAFGRLGRKALARDLKKRANEWLRNSSTTNPTGYTVSVRDLAARPATR
jgi:tetratricopeptide (TPR) repeat protein